MAPTARELEAVLEEVEGKTSAAPMSRAATTAIRPTGPQPMTATRSPGPTPPGRQVHPVDMTSPANRAAGSRPSAPAKELPARGTRTSSACPPWSPAALDPAEQLPHLQRELSPARRRGRRRSSWRRARRPVPGHPLHRAPHLEDLAGELVPQHRPARPTSAPRYTCRSEPQMAESSTRTMASWAARWGVGSVREATSGPWNVSSHCFASTGRGGSWSSGSASPWTAGDARTRLQLALVASRRRSGAEHRGLTSTPKA